MPARDAARFPNPLLVQFDLGFRLPHQLVNGLWRNIRRKIGKATRESIQAASEVRILLLQDRAFVPGLVRFEFLPSVGNKRFYERFVMEVPLHFLPDGGFEFHGLDADVAALRGFHVHALKPAVDVPVVVIADLPSVSVRGLPNHRNAAFVAVNQAREQEREALRIVRALFTDVCFHEDLGAFEGHRIDDRVPTRFHFLGFAVRVIALYPDINQVREHRVHVLKREVTASRFHEATAINVSLHLVAVLIQPPRRPACRPFAQEGIECSPNDLRRFCVDGEITALFGNELIAHRDLAAVIKAALGSRFEVRRDALGDLPTFELGKVCHREHDHLAAGGRGIILVFHRNELAGVLAKEIVHGDEILHGAREPGEFGHHHKANLLTFDRLQHFLKLGPLHVLRRLPGVDVNARDLAKAVTLVSVADFRAETLLLVLQSPIERALLLRARANIKCDAVILVLFHRFPPGSKIESI